MWLPCLTFTGSAACARWIAAALQFAFCNLTFGSEIAGDHWSAGWIPSGNLTSNDVHWYPTLSHYPTGCLGSALGPKAVISHRLLGLGRGVEQVSSARAVCFGSGFHIKRYWTVTWFKTPKKEFKWLKLLLPCGGYSSWAAFSDSLSFQAASSLLYTCMYVIKFTWMNMQRGRQQPATSAKCWVNTRREAGHPPEASWTCGAPNVLMKASYIHTHICIYIYIYIIELYRCILFSYS